MSYAVITPARDEAELLPGLVSDMAGQIVRASRWVIVDDGSSDATGSVARQAADVHDWISAVSLPIRPQRLPGPGVVHAFNAGIRQVNLDDCEFIVKLDADVRVAPDYFSTVLREFAEHPFLGIAGGVCVEDGQVVGAKPAYHVRGATKVYRVACFKDIGGLKPLLPWDAVDEIAAIASGWETRTLAHLQFAHRRAAGSHPASGGHLHARFREGRGNYVRRSLPIMPFLRAARVLPSRPPVLGSLALVWGYLSGFLAGTERVGDPEVARVQRLMDAKRLIARIDVSRIAQAQRERRTSSSSSS